MRPLVRGALRAAGLAAAVSAALFGLLHVPSVQDAFSAAVYRHLDGVPLVLVGSVLTARAFSFCMGDYLGCVKQELADDLIKIYGWDVGVGKLAVFSPSMVRHGYGVLPVFFSHAAYRSWSHDPKAGRPPDTFVFSLKQDLPAGVLPDGEPDILLNFDTGSKEHSSRRELLADMLPALAQNESALPIKAPPGVSASIAAEKVWPSRLRRAIFDVVGYNLFLQLYDVDIAHELKEHYEYDGILAPGVLGLPIMSWQGKRMAQIRGKILAKVQAGEVGKKFMAVAKERGMDPSKRLSEMVWISMFAGYGGVGNLAFETMKHILTDPPRFAAMFRRDPKAFMLEAVRLHPPVGGMNPVAARKTTTHHLANGRDLTMKPGDLAITLNSGANVDPAVFKDPAKFLPGRANATKVLSWNNELDAFASCKTVAGCPRAPRGCPGTWLSLRLATGVTDFFVRGIEAKLGGASAPRADEL